MGEDGAATSPSRRPPALPQLQPEPRPCSLSGGVGRAALRTRSQMPTPDKGATKHLLGPNPTLVQCRSLFQGDSHRDERICLSDGATRRPDHSRGCFFIQSLGSSLPCNCVSSSPTWTHPHPPSSQSVSQNLSSTSCVPSPVLGTRDTEINKTKSWPQRAHSLMGRGTDT